MYYTEPILSKNKDLMQEILSLSGSSLTIANENSQSEVALEAQNLTLAINGTPMKVAIITDKMVEQAGLLKCDNPVPFQGSNPTPTGVFSEKIFGVGVQRMYKYGYIDLGGKFLHPEIFWMLKSMLANIDRVVAGEGAWFIDPNAKDDQNNVMEIKDPKDIRYNQNNTGLNWLIKNWKKIRFKPTPSIDRQNKLELLAKLDESQMFISKWPVIPVIYRDIDTTSGYIKVPEISKLYCDLIRLTNSIKNTGFSFNMMTNKSMYAIQQKLDQFRLLSQGLIQKKRGHLRQAVMGKSVDYGMRSVISVPDMSNIELPKDNPVDILHSGIPLAQCLITGFPFIIKFCEDFFRNTVVERNKLEVLSADGKSLDWENIPNQSRWYNRQAIEKRVEDFIRTVGTRFEPIKIYKSNDGKDFVNLRFLGTATNPKYNSLLNRPFTWCDLFYWAAMETLADKYCWITRYPIETLYSMFPTKVVPISTYKVVPVTIEGKTYDRWPNVKVNAPPEEVDVSFIDTFMMSNHFLEAIGGDYDGDQVSIRIAFSDEANREAEQLMKAKRMFIDTKGRLIRNVNNEAYLTFFSMTNT